LLIFEQPLKKANRQRMEWAIGQPEK